METPFFYNCQFRPLFFGGKGGVGKTTCATAITLANKYPQLSFLLASSDPAYSLADCLADYSPPANISVLELNSQKCLNEFMAEHRQHLREIATRGTFLDDEEKYDCIVTDTAPTGHTLRLLGMPDLVRKWLEALDALLAKHRYMKQLFKEGYQEDELDGFLLDLASSLQQIKSLLADPVRCRFIPVMIAETLSGKETERLLHELHTAKKPITDMVVNNLYPADTNCRMRSEKRQQQNRILGQYQETLSLHTLWGVPQWPMEIRGQELLENFWEKAAVIVLERPQQLSDRVVPFQIPVVEDAGCPPSPALEFLFFARKGGLGKTTLTCATALRMAADCKEKNILTFSTDPVDSLSDCLDVQLGPELTEVMPGLTALEINAEAEFVILKTQYALELEKLFNRFSSHLDIVFDRDVMERVLDLAPPGLDEVMDLFRIIELRYEGQYDLFIFDSAPTGHLLRLLESPEIIYQWLKSLFAMLLKYKQSIKLPGFTQHLVQISKNLKKMRTLLQNGARAHVYAVSILTRMALLETTDFIDACEKSAGSSGGSVFFDFSNHCF